ncbi:helix-turn-helix domain-containing protein [Listeria aquatica]|uniref:helix-turn-helix domain-containing protein n=1 Tax=Listeria aquatica TaxID=1494960 RepID=UPI003F6FAB22
MDLDEAAREKIEFLNNFFVSTKEAIDILQISRQNFYSLVNRNKIHRIKKEGVVLYLRDEILERKNEQIKLRQKYRSYEY